MYDFVNSIVILKKTLVLRNTACIILLIIIHHKFHMFKLKNLIKKLISFYRVSKIKVVYLHIEKSAGTSQRIFFLKNFTEQAVFWYGINSDSKKYNPDETQGHKLLGGHRFFDFYQNPNYLYLAVVRDPIESVVSLYNYFISQNHHIENWSKKPGFDINCFENTLINCQAFRQRIQNHQCRYFSVNKTFADSLSTIKHNNFMIGSLPKINLFNEKLIESLNLVHTNFPKVNKSRINPNKYLTISPSCREHLLKLLEQDFLLYELINTKFLGLYNNITNKQWDRFLKS